ncbi:MAG: 16S rRNA (guanine(966)-N(2))-methyltransferase RsmD [Phycisphaerae bacterium]|nr:16S rRNA (guanine(966)-N(2))-methyltransferase RsmD [Phycisphaerae bacterium]
MRIISGLRRSAKLLSPKTNISRPITDRVKESLFNVLYNFGLPQDAVVADVFSGVGSMGLEAVSRGAKFACFIEKDPIILDTLKKNIAKLGFADSCKVLRIDAFRVGAPPAPSFGAFNLVFVDPPYAKSRDIQQDSLLGGLLNRLCEQTTSDCLIVVRTEKGIELEGRYGALEVCDRRRWGTMTLTFFKKPQALNSKL